MKPRNKRVPLIQLLQQHFPQESSDTLKAWTACGEIEVEGGRIRDPKCLVSHSSVPLHLPEKFVSRGGWKLEGALSHWQWPVQDLVILDAGASTGGFTDCLLQRGARLVHAIDVGRNQLHWKLRQDPRVISQEGTGIMDVTALEPQPDGAVADLSFRSLKGAAAHILDLTAGGWLIALIKPQFEWKSPGEDFKGIVPAEELRDILLGVLQDLEVEGVYTSRLRESGLAGTDGNREFLAFFSRTERIPPESLLDGLSLP